VLARAGEYLKPKWPKGFTKKIERCYMDALRTLVSREGEANDLIAGAWDEFDRPLGLSLD